METMTARWRAPQNSPTSKSSWLLALFLVPALSLGLLSGCNLASFTAYYSPLAITVEDDELVVLVCRDITVSEVRVWTRDVSGDPEWEPVVRALGRHTFSKGESFVYDRPPGFEVQKDLEPDLRPDHQLSVAMYVDANSSGPNGIFTFTNDSKPEAGLWMYVGGEKTVEPCAVRTQ